MTSLWANRKPFCEAFVSQLPHRAGMFVIMADKTPIYVGRSDDVHQALLRHVRDAGNAKIREAIQKGRELQFASTDVVLPFEMLESDLVQELGKKGKIGRLRGEADAREGF